MKKAKRPAKKKVGRKKVANKKVANKRGGKAPSSRQRDEPKPAIPAKLFAGQRVALAGRFSRFPYKAMVTQMLTDEGATLTTAVNNKLDILLVDPTGGGAGKVKTAEKCNRAGAAIRIVDSVEDLWDIGTVSLRDTLTEGGEALHHLSELLDRPWLTGDVDPLSGEDFSKQTIRASGQSVTLDGLSFTDCDFRQATIEQVSLGSHNDELLRCDFSKARLRDVQLFELRDCTLNNTTGAQVDLYHAIGCRLSGVKLDEVLIRSLEDCQLESCRLSDVQLRGHFQRTALARCRVKKSKIHPASCSGREPTVMIADCEFEDVEFSKGPFRSGLSFRNCTLRNVKFADLDITQLRFENCTLEDCTFQRCAIMQTYLTDCIVRDLRWSKSNVGVVLIPGDQVAELRGLHTEAAVDPMSFPLLQQLAAAFKSADELSFHVEATAADGRTIRLYARGDWQSQLTWWDKSNSSNAIDVSLPDNRVTTPVPSIQRALAALFRTTPLTTVDPSTMKVATTKCPLKGNELKTLILDAIHEVNAIRPPDEQEVKQAQRKQRLTKSTARDALKADLAAGDVKAINRRSQDQLQQASPIKKLKLSGAALSKVKLTGIDLSQGDFSKADLAAARLNECNLSKSNLAEANLHGATLTRANLREANLTAANLRGAKLRHANVQGAVFSQADLSQATLSDVDLRGADLSTAKLSGATLQRAQYDEKTTLPDSLTKKQQAAMRWLGGGLPPHERKQNQRVDGPLDFEQFVTRLTEITDAARLSKAMKMLKADAFQLFSEVTEGCVLGVVKSQSDAKLVYSCKLQADGEFTCCTQNLNHCGGLRGALCKHILVLVVGLAKSGELDPTLVDQWVNQSKQKHPSLDKDQMGEVLLKYKGAEAGDIDWRPTETVPEDFMAW